MKKNSEVKRMNDEERRLWVLNDEGLYNWYCSEASRGGGVWGFIKGHRDELDDLIEQRLEVKRA
jgi:hypothetical protein